MSSSAKDKQQQQPDIPRARKGNPALGQVITASVEFSDLAIARKVQRLNEHEAEKPTGMIHGKEHLKHIQFIRDALRELHELGVIDEQGNIIEAKDKEI